MVGLPVSCSVQVIVAIANTMAAIATISTTDSANTMAVVIAINTMSVATTVGELTGSVVKT